MENEGAGPHRGRGESGAVPGSSGKRRTGGGLQGCRGGEALRCTPVLRGVQGRWRAAEVPASWSEMASRSGHRSQEVTEDTGRQCKG